jgi:hypothetical protein
METPRAQSETSPMNSQPEKKLTDYADCAG